MSHSADTATAKLHLQVSLLECDSAATLEETLLLLAALPLHFQRVGARAIVFPARELPLVRDALEENQCFPRIVGQSTQPALESDDEATDEQ